MWLTGDRWSSPELAQNRIQGVLALSGDQTRSDLL
jgi:hypothetical protein